MGIRLYCGINETKWNHHPVQPGGYACVAPVYGKTELTKKENRVFVPEGTEVIQDSGAFSDSLKYRLSVGRALDRQIRHADRWKYAHMVTHRATYDLLIDEVWDESDVRSKRRWTVADAEYAVEETILAANYLDKHREGLSLVVSAQGVDSKQYLRCVESVLPYYREGDILGLGGWCIIGKMPKVMMPVFRDTVNTVIPFLARERVDRIHIWGVIYSNALAVLLKACDEYGIKHVSTDSAGPSYRPAFGLWGYKGWTDKNYIRPETDVRGLERARHVQATRDWLWAFRDTVQYQGVS